jgi:cephalosporin-C deacetylase
VLRFRTLVDLPLDELRRYTGRNERPDDLDEYWERALSELEATPSDIELRPAPFRAPQAESFDLYFNGVGGARIHAKLLKPTRRTVAVPGGVHFHGCTGSAERKSASSMDRSRTERLG